MVSSDVDTAVLYHPNFIVVSSLCAIKECAIKDFHFFLYLHWMETIDHDAWSFLLVSGYKAINTKPCLFVSNVRALLIARSKLQNWFMCGVTVFNLSHYFQPKQSSVCVFPNAVSCLLQAGGPVHTRAEGQILHFHVEVLMLILPSWGDGFQQ